MTRKKRILFISEAAYLNTGYAKYSREVISRIYDTGKYDIAEFSIYGNANDHRRSSISWKSYPNMPDTSNQDQIKVYSSNTTNQFGAWRFERVCLDFKPDIVFTIRDFWMDSFVYHSPYRRLFSWAWMPTVDAAPQNQEWMDMFADADYVLTYSDWAKSTIEEQAGNTVNTVGVASPSAAECFIPMDKSKIRSEFNIKDDVKIIGTVMRNQRRKLFPALLESFRKYLEKSQSVDTFLYLHTSFPDSGWNLAELIHENQLSSKVLMTYVCESCQNVETSFFRDSKKICSKCKKFTSTPASVGNGVSDKVLAKIYNIFDLYIQCANSEGFGLPQVEAAACGVPVACTNYSAMRDLVSKVDAYPIDYTYYKELETGCDRAVPKTESIVSIFSEFFNLTPKEKEDKSKLTRSLFEKNYSWDRTSEQWMKIADECPYSDWSVPAKIIQPQQINKNEKSILRFMSELVANYCYYDPHKNSYFVRTLMTDLKRGISKATWDGYYISEFSPFSSYKPKPIDRETVLKVFESRLKNYNIWESLRMDESKLIDKEEKWLN